MTAWKIWQPIKWKVAMLFSESKVLPRCPLCLKDGTRLQVWEKSKSYILCDQQGQTLRIPPAFDQVEWDHGSLQEQHVPAGWCRIVEQFPRSLRMRIFWEDTKKTWRKVTNGGRLSCAKWTKTHQGPSRKGAFSFENDNEGLLKGNYINAVELRKVSKNACPNAESCSFEYFSDLGALCFFSPPAPWTEQKLLEIIRVFSNTYGICPDSKWNPRDPGSPSENGWWHLNYLAFRRWLYNPIILWRSVSLDP